MVTLDLRGDHGDLRPQRDCGDTQGPGRTVSQGPAVLPTQYQFPGGVSILGWYNYEFVEFPFYTL